MSLEFWAGINIDCYVKSLMGCSSWTLEDQNAEKNRNEVSKEKVDEA